MNGGFGPAEPPESRLTRDQRAASSTSACRRISPEWPAPDAIATRIERWGSIDHSGCQPQEYSAMPPEQWNTPSEEEKKLAREIVRHESFTLVKVILAINALVFLCWLFLPVPFMADNFLVSWSQLAGGRVWTLVTAVFSHYLLFHLLINMIVLWSFGPLLAWLMGAREFLFFYLTAGVMGSLAHALVSNLLMDQPEQAALGASAALAGVLLLFSLTFPRAKVLFFFIIPTPAIVAALIFIGIDLWGLIMQIEANGGWPIGHGAHLGGALTGIVYFLIRGRKLKREKERRDVPDLG
ncbi:MAG: rhomboid family intramembrane serine protease [Wenzhouxiangella sp.]|nr:MAG: rhomboid family intramembrane serine protease [Wenzhouxiangella sp.]